MLVKYSYNKNNKIFVTLSDYFTNMLIHLAINKQSRISAALSIYIQRDAERSD